MSTFQELSLPPFLLEKIESFGFQAPTEIQDAAIPPLLEGQDAILQSQTGTGKTLAYLLPILARLDAENPVIQALILTPSQELAMQILAEVRKLTEGTSLVAQQLIGGANIRHQLDRLKKKPHLIVGTPGRIRELASGGKIKLDGLRTLVIDEVDQVLAFRADLQGIKKYLPRDRQTLFVSATIPPAIREEAARWMREVQHLQAQGQALPTGIEHGYLVCENRDKIDTLRRLIHASRTQAAIAFLNESHKMDEVYSKLSFKGLEVAPLMGGRKEDRATALKAFREGTAHVLLTTELGARGLDIQGVTHVFNLGLPTDAEHYLHRAGRCGRLGQAGTVISLVAPKEKFVLEKFAKALGIAIAPYELSFGQLKPASPQGKNEDAEKVLEKVDGDGSPEALAP